jgi:transcriptional regulator with XRE-family HTH domain
MGKAIGGLPETPALIGGEDASGSIGAYIARQRKLRGISLEELEVLTRIPRRSLERLESGAFDAEPDGFVRGFVRTVSVAIGLDPDDTVTRMLVEPDPRGKKSRIPNLSAAARFLLLMCLIAVAAAILWTLLEVRPEGLPDASLAHQTRPVRRDAIRELAISRGIIPETAIPGVQPLAPVESSPPE